VGTLHEDMYTFIISCSVLLMIRNVSDKSCRENQYTHVIFNNFIIPSFPSENCAVYEIMWENIVEPDKPQMAIWRLCVACCITKATNTHPEYVILIAFPLQQWLHNRTSIQTKLFQMAGPLLLRHDKSL